MPQAAWLEREQALAQPGLPALPSLASWLLQQTQEISAKLVRVEAHAEILDAQDSASINNGSKKRVVHVTIGRFRGKYAVLARHVPNGHRVTGKEAPASEISGERLCVLLQYRGRVALWVDGDGNEYDFHTEIMPELILNVRHHRRQYGAGVRTRSIYESYGHHLTPKVCERNLRAVLGGQGETGCRGDFGQPLLLSMMTRIVRLGQRRRCQEGERQNDRHQHDQPFSSRLSSFRKRQSVASARILLGLTLIMPAWCSRSA